MLASRRVRAWLWLALPLGCAAYACSTTPDGGGNSTGGSSTTGGAAISTGGTAPSTGGTAPLTGGTVSTGGTVQATGGTVSTGGIAPATGGSQSGGDGGVSTGGATAGGSGGGAGTGGAGMLKGAVVRGDKCVLEFGDLYFEVANMPAGRVTSARIGQSEILTGPSVDPANYGSTFWTSPQADWSWPPLPEMDTVAFTATSDDISCTLTGPKISASAHPNVDGLSLTKKFTADFAKQAVAIQYTIKNEGSASKRVAPWEITRVVGGGLTFYASDSTPTAGTMPLLPTTTGAGCQWFKHTSSVVESKLFADGKGWVAHVTPQNLILIKSFPNIMQSEAASGEAEIEIYASPVAKNYVEVENQGAISDIPAGGVLNWTVRWYVRTLPSTITATPGSQALVDFVTQTIQ